MLKQAHLYIKGNVIGVGFRAWTKIQAIRIGINGWVKNVHDTPEVFGQGGGVEITIQGEEKNINRMLNLLKKGPPASEVNDVKILWEKPKEIFGGFEIRR